MQQQRQRLLLGSSQWRAAAEEEQSILQTGRDSIFVADADYCDFMLWTLKDFIVLHVAAVAFSCLISYF